MKPLANRPPTRPVPPPVIDDEDDEVLDGHELRMSFWEHLEDLRNRLFRAALALVIGTGVGVAIGGQVLTILQAPYGKQFQVLGPTEGVVSYFRVSLMVGAILASPVITYQLLMFIVPGLTNKEKRMMLTALPAITLLFLIGAGFAWFILVPPALGFLENFQPTLFRPEWTADLYLSFVTALIFWMGVAFQTPLIFFVLSLMGVVGPRALIRNWRVAVVGAAVAAALITPTIDPVNMFLVMGPLLTLYVLSIFLVMIGRRLSRVDEPA